MEQDLPKSEAETTEHSSSETPESAEDKLEKVTEKSDSPKELSLQEKHDELTDQHLRLAADFENFRKRAAQERASLLKYGAENTVQGLLPILDNLERASNSLNEDSDPKMLYQSFNLLTNQLLETLKHQGLQKIETTGQLFDPNFHEATAQIETLDQPENTIVHEMQSGFMLHERVIRPALVSVATPPNQSEVPAENNPFAHSQETEPNS